MKSVDRVNRVRRIPCHFQAEFCIDARRKRQTRPQHWRFLAPTLAFFLLKPAGKVLEWLIRRFRVQEFNIDAVVACILPYHETKAFVKMVSLLKIA